ncbi:hypothetical protein ACLBYN_47515, partial [Pseudomonas aeruginosa]
MPVANSQAAQRKRYAVRANIGAVYAKARRRHISTAGTFSAIAGIPFVRRFACPVAERCGAVLEV